MEFLYGLDALLGIVVSVGTLIGFLTMSRRRGASQAQTADAPSRPRRGFAFLSVLVAIAVGLGGWAYLSPSSDAGARNPFLNKNSGLSRFERIEKRKWRNQRERRWNRW